MAVQLAVLAQPCLFTPATCSEFIGRTAFIVARPTTSMAGSSVVWPPFHELDKQEQDLTVLREEVRRMP